jgi:hypothetical protein
LLGSLCGGKTTLVGVNFIKVSEDGSIVVQLFIIGNLITQLNMLSGVGSRSNCGTKEIL